jgi:hypothetical protein
MKLNLEEEWFKKNLSNEPEEIGACNPENLQEEDSEGNRIGVGEIDCIYCGEKDCNFSCDESQAGGFNHN